MPLTLTRLQRFWHMAWLLVGVYGLFAAIYFVTHFKGQKAFALILGGWHMLATLEVIRVIPELVTLLALQKILWFYHRLIPISTVRLTPLGLARYYLVLLPPMLAVFFVISPFTQTVRYFLETPIVDGVGAMTFHNYLQEFLIGPYRRPKIVALYLLLIPVLGYGMISVSLVNDLFTWRHRQKEAQPDEESQKPVYATTLTVQSSLGQNVILCSEVGLITSESRNCLIHHTQGIYKLINRTITEVEADLNPDQFFRVSRGCLVNRAFVEGHVHTRNNNYIIHFKAPFNQSSVSLSRPRLTEFRQWLHASIGKQGPSK